MSYRVIVLFILAFNTAGCASFRPVDVAKPSEITVQAALEDVANGLAEFKKKDIEGKRNYGLLVDEVTVTLNLTAAANDSTKLVVDAGNIKPAGLAGGTANVNYEYINASNASKGNNVTIKMKNIYTAALNEQGKGAKISVDGKGQVRVNEGDILLGEPIN